MASRCSKLRTLVGSINPICNVLRKGHKCCVPLLDTMIIAVFSNKMRTLTFKNSFTSMFYAAINHYLNGHKSRKAQE